MHLGQNNTKYCKILRCVGHTRGCRVFEWFIDQDNNTSKHFPITKHKTFWGLLLLIIFFYSGLESKICKHFITHGCKLGSRCRFLHCTLEELANNMASNEQGFSRPPRGRGGRYDAGPPPPRHTLNGAESDMNNNSNSPPIHNAASREEHTQDIDTQAS